MNAKKLIAAVAVFAAANSALAAEWVEFTNVTSTKTRAEVMAEMKQARDDGSYAAARQEYVEPAAAVATAPAGKTRAQVQAELAQSVADGSYAALHQEYQGQYRAIGKAASTQLAGEAGAANAN